MLRRFMRGLGAGVAALALASTAQAATYSFDSYVGTTNDFSITADGMTATFTSSSGPGTFVVAQPTGLYTFPVALGDYGAFNGDPLTITFSDPVVDRILIPFGIEEAFATVPATMVARTNTGQTVVFTTEFNNLISGAPEGVVSFVPSGPITSLTLLSSFGFAIASVEVPEPGSMLLLGAGLAGAAVARRRRG